MSEDIRTMVSRLLDYDPLSGEFTNRVSRGCRRAGARAGSTRKDTGYIAIHIGGRDLYAHRLAWLLIYGDPGLRGVDHINGNPSDNRIANLRLATVSQNQMNIPVFGRRGKGSRRLVGTYYAPQSGTYRARLTVDGKCYHLGYFDTEHAAHEAYLEARKVHCGEFSPIRGEQI
jgi:hypothetical protein